MNVCSGPSLASRYGEREWLAKEGCQRITRKSCNLTLETGNPTEHYYARVTAISAGGPSATKMTDRFSSLYHSEWAPLTAGKGRETAQEGSGGPLETWLLGKVAATTEHPMCTVHLPPAPSRPPEVSRLHLAS